MTTVVMHKLLQRQLRRHFGSLEAVPPELSRFLESVDDAYRSADEGRAMQERALDLTSQEMMEKNHRLREEGEEIRQLIERIPDGVLVCRNDRIVFVNSAWAEYLDRPTEEGLIGRNITEFAAPDDRSALLARIRSLEEADAASERSEIRFLRGDGSTVLLELSHAQHIRFEGEPAVILDARDVTERKRIEARTLLADRMRCVGTLVAGVAHEINNPLSYIISNLGFLESELAGGSSEVVSALADTRDGADRVKRIVRDLKDFSRTDDERQGPVDLNKAMEAALKITGNQLKHRARILIDHRATKMADANESRLGQVLVNLLVNAVQAFTLEGATSNEIRISTLDLPGGQVCVDVSDNGCGIPQEILSKIFDPFFTTKPVGVGTGLGLSICHGIVTTMKGEIAVQSEVGVGTTFRVVLPAIRQSYVEETTPLLEPIATRIARILVIDDEPQIGSSVKRALRDSHHVVFETAGANALKRLLEEPFDVVLCDLMMPGMTGMDLFELMSAEIRAKTVFMTGGVFTRQAQQFLERLPSHSHVEKPLGVVELRELVARLVA